MLYFFLFSFQQRSVVVCLQIQREFLNLQAFQMSMMITKSATGTLDSSMVSAFTWVFWTLTLKMTQLAWLTMLKYTTVTMMSMALWEGMCCSPYRKLMNIWYFAWCFFNFSPTAPTILIFQFIYSPATFFPFLTKIFLSTVSPNKP